MSRPGHIRGVTLADALVDLGRRRAPTRPLTASGRKSAKRVTYSALGTLADKQDETYPGREKTAEADESGGLLDVPFSEYHIAEGLMRTSTHSAHGKRSTSPIVKELTLCEVRLGCGYMHCAGFFRRHNWCRSCLQLCGDSMDEAQEEIYWGQHRSHLDKEGLPDHQGRSKNSRIITRRSLERAGSSVDRTQLSGPIQAHPQKPVLDLPVDGKRGRRELISLIFILCTSLSNMGVAP